MDENGSRMAQEWLKNGSKDFQNSSKSKILRQDVKRYSQEM